MTKNGHDKIQGIIEGAEVIASSAPPEQTAKVKHGRAPSQAEILIESAKDTRPFQGTDGTTYADVQVEGHRETWILHGAEFEQWLIHRFYQQTQTVPSSEAWHAALKILGAKARFDGPTRDVHRRIAGSDNRIYLDLGGADWRAVEIDPDGWRVITDPPVQFWRPPGMLELPVPKPGGSIDALRPFLNVKDKADFIMSVAWLLAALHPRGPYSVMVVTGEHGTAKSTFSAVLRRIVDPNIAKLKPPPRTEEDLFIEARHAHVLAFDNVSSLKLGMSDALCRLASGGVHVTRKLYTNHEQVVLAAQCPVILNSIEQVVTKEDLASRAIGINLPLIDGKKRLPEAQFWAGFDKALPGILGALLDAVSCGLRNMPSISPSKYPRMADFAHFVMACEPRLWLPGTFEAAYRQNRDEAIQLGIETDAVASAVLELATQTMQTMQTQTSQSPGKVIKVFEGTATELLRKLRVHTDDSITRSRYWPTPQKLRGRLKRAAPGLREWGIEIEWYRVKRESIRMVYLTLDVGKFEERSSASFAPEPCAVPEDSPKNTSQTSSASSASSAGGGEKPAGSSGRRVIVVKKSPTPVSPDSGDKK